MQTLEFVSLALALAIHEDVIQTNGGTPGVRDLGLLESALCQPQAEYFGQVLHPSISDKAAAYLFFIAKNHAFHDGNKRTALAIMLTFLGMNGYEVLFSDDELYDLTIKVATDVLDKSKAAEFICTKIIKS